MMNYTWLSLTRMGHSSGQAPKFKLLIFREIKTKIKKKNIIFILAEDDQT